MKSKIISVSFSIFYCWSIVAQQPKSLKDSTKNNLALPEGYVTSQYGGIPEFRKSGRGKQTAILIPGLGFDASVFDDFVEANKSLYIMYAVTIPGYGQSKAPPMPSMGTSYGDQSWNKSFEEGLIKLIQKEKIHKPVIIGSFTQGTQLAIRMAIDYPDQIGSVVVLGGPAKFIFIDKGVPRTYPLKNSIAYIDHFTVPNFFKGIGKEAFDQGNYLPEIYSLDSSTGNNLWKIAASPPLSVMVRYLCEFLASDITVEFDKIKCPVLVLRSKFSQDVLRDTVNSYVKPQFIDSWDDIAKKNSWFVIKDITDASAFVWKDKPTEVYNEIKAFILKKN